MMFLPQPAENTPQTVSYWNEDRMKANITATQASIKAAVMSGDLDRARLLIGRNVLARMTLKGK